MLQYEPDDLTIGVEAGMTLAALQALLAEHGQILPLDVPRPAEVSIGALVAAAADGPRRLGYGTLRDWVLALTVLEADGTVARLGAQVVKNVTGYDLVKLFVGSRGTLGLIAAVSLKVFPRPRESATLLLACAGRDAALALAGAIGASKLQPTAVEYLAGFTPPAQGAAGWAGAGQLLAVRCEGHPAAVARHRRELAELAAAGGAALAADLAGPDEAALWAAVVGLADRTVGPAECLLRLAAPPAELGAALEQAAVLAARHSLALSVSARALSGLAYLRAAGDEGGRRALYAGLAERWVHAHMLAGELAPSWGAAPAALGLMRAIKAEIDPYGTMNPGASIV